MGVPSEDGVVRAFAPTTWLGINHSQNRWVHDERRWIPAFAGMTVVVETNVKFPPSSLACDDCCVGGSLAIRIPHSLPAQAGIQWLSLQTISSTLPLTSRWDTGSLLYQRPHAQLMHTTDHQIQLSTRLNKPAR
jgi:hypothetical protein